MLDYGINFAGWCVAQLVRPHEFKLFAPGLIAVGCWALEWQLMKRLVAQPLDTGCRLVAVCWNDKHIAIEIVSRVKVAYDFDNDMFIVPAPLQLKILQEAAAVLLYLRKKEKITSPPALLRRFLIIRVP